MTAEQILACDYINAEFPKYEKQLTEFVTFDNLVSEAFSLNAIEDVLPNKIFTEIHLGKILNESGSRVKEYYLGLAGGKNQILEEARALGLSTQQINEAIEDFRNFIKHKLFEDAMALGAPVASAGGFDAALTGGEKKAPASGSKWTILGTLKSIWNGLTEGGSVIGIIHLIIDIVGLVGDFIFPGVGVVADIINAIIYAIRGKWLLALISVIAAVIVGAGDGLKLFKPVVHTAEPIFVALTKRGGVEAASELAGKAASKGPVMRFLGLLASMLGTALSKASTLLGKFIQGIGKIFSWIPGLNKLTTPLFEGLGRVFTKFGDSMKLFADNFALMEKGAAKAAVNTIDDVIANGHAASFIISKDGKWVTLLGKDTKYPAEAVARAYNMVATKGGKTMTFKNGAQWVKYWKATAKPSVKAAFKDRFLAFFMTRFNKEAAENFSKRLPYFVGKQIYKLIFGSNFVEGQSKWTKDEVEGHGNGAFNDFINQRIAAEKKKTGADFVPSLMLDSSDKEAFDHISDYQNHYAEMTGKPSIMHVVYDKADNSPDAKQFKSFFDKVSSGEIKRGGPGDIVRTGTSSDIRDTGKVNNESRTVFSFKDFKKR
jgi:hypothetical protein